MILARRVALDGVYLDDLDSRIVISSVETADGKDNITAVDMATGYGQRITGERRSTLDIVIKFRIHNYGRSAAGMQARAEVLEKVNAWAALGGYLTVNFKPDRRVHVVLAQAPGEGSLWTFDKEFQMTFRAYGIPYWEQETARTISFGGSGTSGSGTATIEGSVKTQADVILSNTSGMTINAASVNVGGYAMTFASLGLGANEALVIDHTAEGLVRIRIRSAGGSYRSVMGCRSPESTNDFMAAPGARGCAYSAQRACSMTVSWRARYL